MGGRIPTSSKCPRLKGLKLDCLDASHEGVSDAGFGAEFGGALLSLPRLAKLN